MSGEFPGFWTADIIRDSVDIAIEEREPRLEELAAELPSGTGTGAFPDPKGFLSRATRPFWMLEDANVTFLKDVQGKYIWRRSIIEVKAHLHCDAQTLQGSTIDNLAATAGTAVSTDAFDLNVGTTTDGEDLTTTFADNGGSGTFWLSAVNAVDQQNGTVLVNFVFRQVRKWVLATTDPA
jgi:hypothetical protein